jgi:hypothetical protein
VTGPVPETPTESVCDVFSAIVAEAGCVVMAAGAQTVTCAAALLR